MNTNLQKLAVAQAIFNVVSGVVSTKEPGNLRGTVDAEARELYERDGIKSRDVLLNGVKVGTYSAVCTKPKKAVEPSTEERVVMHDVEQFDRWLASLDSAALLDLASWIRMHIGGDALAEYWLYANGELPGGCEILTVELEGRPAEPPRFKNMVLKVDERAVADALAGELPAAVAGLLAGGGQDA